MSNDDRDGELDALFDDIVSHWDTTAAEPDRGPGPGKAANPPPRIRFEHEVDRGAADGGDEDPASPGGTGQAGDPADDAPGPAPTGGPGSGWRTHEVEEEEEHYVPPPPQPLPAGDLQFWGILVGLVGGPGLLLYLIMFDRHASSLWIALAIALSLCGFGLLVARLPSRRDGEDDDDGARV